MWLYGEFNERECMFYYFILFLTLSVLMFLAMK
jgi:hypothetical protein